MLSSTSETTTTDGCRSPGVCFTSIHRHNGSAFHSLFLFTGDWQIVEFDPILRIVGDSRIVDIVAAIGLLLIFHHILPGLKTMASEGRFAGWHNAPSRTLLNPFPLRQPFVGAASRRAASRDLDARPRATAGPCANRVKSEHHRRFARPDLQLGGTVSSPAALVRGQARPRTGVRVMCHLPSGVCQRRPGAHRQSRSAVGPERRADDGDAQRW